LKGWCWTRDAIKPGDSISMTGRRLKNGSPHDAVGKRRVIDASGKVIYKGNDPGQPNEPGPCAPARTGGR
jgi:hypothetical protein